MLTLWNPASRCSRRITDYVQPVAIWHNKLPGTTVDIACSVRSPIRKVDNPRLQGWQQDGIPTQYLTLITVTSNSLAEDQVSNPSCLSFVYTYSWQELSLWRLSYWPTPGRCIELHGYQAIQRIYLSNFDLSRMTSSRSQHDVILRSVYKLLEILK